MSTKHTPGPWGLVSDVEFHHVIQEANRAGHEAPQGESLNERLANLPPAIGCVERPSEVRDGNPNADADARLIAAAPDLLAALTVARLYVANMAEASREKDDAAVGSHPSVTAGMEEDLEQVGAAIAKAH